MSAHKLSNKGYKTIFHPENEGVTVHKKGTLTITTSNPPVLQGCNKNGGKLWTVTATKNNEEEINNVYNLPSTNKAYATSTHWQDSQLKVNGLKPSRRETTSLASAHSRGSTQTFSRIRQKTERTHETTAPECQISTKVKQNAPDNHNEETHQDKPHAKLRDVYIKIYLVSNTVHSDQTRCFPAMSSSGNKFIMVLIDMDRKYIDAEPGYEKQNRGIDDQSLLGTM
jgi:hypothetical protein